MSDIVLDVEKRDLKEKNLKLRHNGVIPAVVYGHNKDNVLVKFNEKEFSVKLKGNTSSNVFIDLNFTKESDLKTVYIKEVQKDVISRQILHIDFVEINPEEKIHVDIPIKVTGLSAGVAEGGVLEFSHRSIEVSCLPKDTPKAISLDISKLHAGDSIHVDSIDLGENVKIITAKGVVIVSVIAAKKEKEKEETTEESTEAK